jgi:hypothetical protein
VDLLACTEPPPNDDVHLPYAAFGIELPYTTKWEGGDGSEVYRTAIASRFGNIDKGVEDWHVVCRTTVDNKRAPGCVSIAAGTSILGTLLSNLCAYLAEGGKKTRYASKLRHQMPAKKFKAPVNVWRLDPPLVASIPIGVARSYVQAGEAPPKSFRIGKRFMVRGHWREQACGPGHTERKKRWIMPYMKGPDEGEAFSKVYKVGGKR